ncbi:MAG: YIP1 family protein [Glaciecola sp.]
MQNNNNIAEVNNPFAALTQIFYQPKAVFDALAVRENWSWIPFLLMSVCLFFTTYLYYSVVDFEWWKQVMAETMLGDVSPSEKNALMNATTLETTRLTSAISIGIVMPIIGYALLALYYNVVTRNDDKSVQGFTDWYGAMWWMALPTIISALLSVIMLTVTDVNAQISENILSPLSLAFILSSATDSPWHNLLGFLRLDFIWVFYMAYVCVTSWTNFSTQKAVITAAAPFVLFITVFLFMGLR